MYVWQSNKTCTCRLIDFIPVLMLVLSRQHSEEKCFNMKIVHPELYTPVITIESTVHKICKLFDAKSTEKRVNPF